MSALDDLVAALDEPHSTAPARPSDSRMHCVRRFRSPSSWDSRPTPTMRPTRRFAGSWMRSLSDWPLMSTTPLTPARGPRCTRSRRRWPSSTAVRSRTSPMCSGRQSRRFCSTSPMPTPTMSCSGRRACSCTPGDVAAVSAFRPEPRRAHASPQATGHAHHHPGQRGAASPVSPQPRQARDHAALPRRGCGTQSPATRRRTCRRTHGGAGRGLCRPTCVDNSRSGSAPDRRRRAGHRPG